MSIIITDPFRQKLLLSAVALGVLMDGIDGSIVIVALPTMATYFGTDAGTIAWVIITYLLMMAGLLLVFGKLADRGLAKKKNSSSWESSSSPWVLPHAGSHRLSTSYSVHDLYRE